MLALKDLFQFVFELKQKQLETMDDNEHNKNEKVFKTIYLRF